AGHLRRTHGRPMDRPRRAQALVEAGPAAVDARRVGANVPARLAAANGRPRSPIPILRFPMQPDLVLVICDTARADAFKPWGGPCPTPTMERLAREGVAYRNATTQAPWTLPSTASIMSGKLPTQHGIHNDCLDWSGDRPTTPATAVRGVTGEWLPETLQ